MGRAPAPRRARLLRVVFLRMGESARRGPGHNQQRPIASRPARPALIRQARALAAARPRARRRPSLQRLDASGTVVRVGPGKYDKEAEGGRAKPVVKEGDRVLYFKYAGEGMSEDE